jgi:uncharacterized membrane protein
MRKPILYAGDTTLTTAAGYLAGVLTHAGLEFDYLPSDAPAGEALAEGAYDLYILSDYPVNRLTAQQMAGMVRAVQAGSGLWMIGGWESFFGAEGEYNDAPLADALPVVMQNRDDRVNCAQPCLMEIERDHELLAGLPWHEPPGIGGYNRVTVKPEAMLLLSARSFRAVRHGAVGFGETHWEVEPGSADPLLVVGTHGQGRTVALTTDVAPHWAGGFVDWGTPRVTARAEGAEQIEVGGYYAELLTRIVRWASSSAAPG